MSKKARLGIAAVALLGAALPLPVSGQSEEPALSEESALAENPEHPEKTVSSQQEPTGQVVDHQVVDHIVVVARRREEDLQQVPISMTVFDETAFEERSMTQITDIGTFTPNVLTGTTFGFGIQAAELVVFIRGIGQLDTAIFSDPGVGLYLDGVFLARAQGSVLDLLDVERVEVLRGPQGTLFGKNTTGGAISIVTKRPTEDLSARLSATLGRYDRHDARASVAGPLHETLSASLALLTKNSAGFARSLWTGAKYNADNHDAGRLVLHWTPSPTVTVDLTGDYTRAREPGGNQILLALTETPLLDFYNRAHIAAGLLPVTEALWLTPGFYDSYSADPSFVNQDVYGTSVNARWLLSGSTSLRTITSYRGFNIHFGGDVDAVPHRVAYGDGLHLNDQFSQEVQLSGLAANQRLSWVVGGLFFRERPRSRDRADILRDTFEVLEAAPGPVVAPPDVPPELCDPGPPPPGVPCFGGAGNPANLFWFNGFGNDTHNRLGTDSRAVFGEVTYDVSARVSATFGIRYSRDDKWFHYVNTNALGVVDADLYNEDHWEAVTPRASLSYQMRPSFLLYLTAANGFKSGGFNGRPQNRGVLDAFDPEQVWTYEAGWKSDLLRHSIRLNGALFWSDYDDIHFAASLEDNGAPVFVTQNAGRAEIKGFELELEAYPAPRLNVSASVGYTDSDLVEVDPRVPLPVEKGVRLPKSPEWMINTALQYSFDLGEKGALIARGDYRFTSKVYNDLTNFETIAQDAFALVNARLSWITHSGHFDVAAFVTNLTDEEYIAHGSVAAAFGFHLGVTGRPREWGLTAQWRF